jgi:hypothetical protein
MLECIDLGIPRVWMHRGVGPGSFSIAAAEYGRAHGITVIDGGCPLMFGPTADGAHKAMRFVFAMTGKVPRFCETGAIASEGRARRSADQAEPEHATT